MTEKILRDAVVSLGRTLRLSWEALETLKSYSWPGNVRELKNVILRASLLCDGSTIGLHHLSFDQPIGSVPGGIDLPRFDRPFPFADPVAAQDYISRALEATAGNQTKAARILGISRRTLINRLDDYGIPRPRAKGRRTYGDLSS